MISQRIDYSALNNLDIKPRGVFIVLRKIINQFNVKLLLIQISDEKSSVRKKLCFNCTGEKHRPVSFVTENAIHPFLTRISVYY